MTDKSNPRAENTDTDVTVVGELNPGLMRRALRSEPPPSTQRATADQLVTSTTLPKAPRLLVPPPPSRRTPVTPAAPMTPAAPITLAAPMEADVTSVLPPERLNELKESVGAGPSPTLPAAERSVILSEPAPPPSSPSDDESTKLWQRPSGPELAPPPLAASAPKSSRQGLASYEVTTARALRLRQAQASQRREALVFGMGMIVGGLAATVILLAVLLSLVFSGRIQFLAG